MEHDNESLVEKIRGGFCVTENMQSLYENNLPLIKKFIKPYTAYECEADLLQESYFGLWEAVQHYETSKNVRFMTYAEYWILLAVRQYIEKCGSTIRIPNYERQKMLRCKRAIDQIRQEQGRESTAAEIAAFIGVSVKEVQEMQGYMQSAASLDTPIAEDNSLTLADTLQADFSLENDTIDKIYAEYAKNELWGIVERYTDIRENGIIKEIFLHGKTMAQVAREQGITIERVRQIKEKGLRKLKTGRARRELRKKFDIAEAGLYRGGLNNYREHNFTSIVERTAMKEIEAEERYKQHLAEIEEHYKQHLKGIEERYRERMALSGRKS